MTRWSLGRLLVSISMIGLSACSDSTGPARVASGHRGSAPAEFQASILEASEADLLVVHGALGPMRGAMLSSEDGLFGDPISALAVDTLIPVPPRSGPGSAIAVFGHANRPLIAEPAWTEGSDTVHVTLEPPVSIDLWLDIRQGDYEEVVQRLAPALDTALLGLPSRAPTNWRSRRSVSE